MSWARGLRWLRMAPVAEAVLEEAGPGDEIHLVRK